MPDATTQRRTCRLVTLGCKVNQYETQHVLETLEANGYQLAAPGEATNLVVVNTCTVTHEADAKARQLIRQLGKAHPDAAIVVTGCYATRDPEAVRHVPGVRTVISDKTQLLESLRPYGVHRVATCITRFEGHQRAFVKVQDGCLLNCTFCIIPSVRPTMRSRPLADVVDEVRRLVDGGCPEIVLTGIHLGHYGIDLSKGKPKMAWTRLWHLVDRLSSLPGDFRIRLSSLEAAECRDDLLRVLQDNPRVCPHLHLCLQSGSDRILQAMRRRYSVRSYLERCVEIKQRLHEPAITTDVIVGFPGETETDFAETLAVAREVGFAKMHVFPFSPRIGTPAASLPDQVDPKTLARRKGRLASLDAELERAYVQRLVGQQVDLLVEGAVSDREGWMQGITCRKVTARMRGTAALIRRRVPVQAFGMEDNALLAEPIAVGNGSVPSLLASHGHDQPAVRRMPLQMVANAGGCP